MSSVTVYNDMTPDVASAAQMAAERIKANMRTATASIFEVGADLLAAKKMIGHGHFIEWIEAEFGMSRMTATRLMNVADQFGGKCNTVRHLPPTVLYALAAPSTPDAVRDEALHLAESGEPVTSDVVVKLKEKLKATKAEAREAQDNAEVAAAQARQLMDMSAEADNELLFLRAKLKQAAEEIERLKQDGVIHSYPAEPQPAPVPSAEPARRKPYSFLPSIAALIADGCRRDLEEIVSMLRQEGLYGLASEVEAASQKQGEAA